MIPGGGDAYALMRRFFAPVYEGGKLFYRMAVLCGRKKGVYEKYFFQKTRAVMAAFLLAGAVAVNGGFCGCAFAYAAANGETGIQAAGNSPATEGDSRSKAAALRDSRDNRPEAASLTEDNAEEKNTEEISETVSNTQKNTHEESNRQEINTDEKAREQAMGRR